MLPALHVSNADIACAPFWAQMVESGLVERADFTWVISVSSAFPLGLVKRPNMVSSKRRLARPAMMRIPTKDG